MAEISNSTMFTNDTSSTGASDLLRQAFQEVVDDDDHGSEFVAFLQNDESDRQTIHLTHEQVVALGLTFEVNSSEEVMYHQQQDQDNDVANSQESVPTKDNNIHGQEQTSLSPRDEPMSIDQLSYQSEEVQKSNDTGLDSVDCIDFQEWHEVSQTDGQATKDDLSLDEIDLSSRSDESQRTFDVQDCTTRRKPNGRALVLEHPERFGNTHNDNFINVWNTIEAHRQLNSAPSAQTQILQKLPALLPSSQFILKPAQTVLKPAKSIRLLKGSNKLVNTSVSSINVNSLRAGLNSNSVLLSKATLLNTITPHVIKAAPMTAQLLNANGIQAQLLSAPQLLTGACEIQNQSVGTSHVSNVVVNGMSGTTQSLVGSQIRLSPVVKTSQQPQLQRGNLQQFLTPVLKGPTVLPKTNQILSNSNTTTTTVPAQFLRSVTVSPHLLKTKAVIGKKITGASKITANSNAQVVLRAAPIVKGQDLKTSSTTSSMSILKPTQISSTPISILKPQAKIAINNSNKQNVTVATQSVCNVSSNSQNNNLQKPAQASSAYESAKSFYAEIVKHKLNLTANDNSKLNNKKAKSAPAKSAAVPPEEPTNVSKLLGSTENSIQIVQQGQTFQSVQRLSQTQLKQIAQVLQQRSQEAAASNEKVVYRVVFPEELDLQIKNPGNSVKNRGGKRGRPKKNAARPASIPPKPTPVPDEEQEELKDERKKVVARTRSGRLSRPPRHMVRDYKHLRHLDFSQPDLDDSDGGYSDYNTNNDKLDEEESPKELLTGLEVPKRKISDSFRCPKCNKIYLGHTRMARHFELNPDHGSPEQLPPPTPEPESKPNGGQDPLKRKGKKRGPWAYATPEAKSERRQIKLQEAISVCEDVEIIKIAAKPVVNAQSLFDLLVLKSENNTRKFFDEFKQLIDKVREKTGTMLTVANVDEESGEDLIDIGEESLCDVLGLAPGLYKINDEALKEVVDSPVCAGYENGEEPPLKLRKLDNSEDGKENVEEMMSSGFSESSDLSVSDFLSEKRSDSGVGNPTCPEVLSALTLMRRNPSPVNHAENDAKSNGVSKLLISNPEIQSQISDSPGFQKVDITPTKGLTYQKLESHEQDFGKLGNDLGSPTSFCKGDDNFEQSKMEDRMEQAFIKLEPTKQGFVKLDNGAAMEAYSKQESQSYEKMQNGLDDMENGSPSFVKGFPKLVAKIIPMIPSDADAREMIPTAVGCKISDGLPMLQDAVSIMPGTCDGSIFGSSENLDDHITHFTSDILNTSGVIDKNLIMDEKFVEHMRLVGPSDQSEHLVDELVSERLNNIMPADNVLDNSLTPNNSNLDTDLDFDAFDFNRNTRS